MTHVRSLPPFVVTMLTALAFLPASPTSAQPAGGISSYTSTADKNCRKLSSVKVGGDEEYGSERICRVPQGWWC